MGNLLEMILKAQGGAIVKNMAKQHGLDAGSAFNAIKSLLPAITKGMNNNIQSEGGLGGLLDALNKGSHQKYIENAEDIVSQAATKDGNSILGHILGSKDVSRQVAAQAAQATGIDISILKKMLPQVAGAAMGGMSKRVNSAESGGLLDALTKASQQSGQSGGALNDLLGQVMGGGQKSSGGLGGLLGGLFGGRKKAAPQAPDLGGLLGSLLGGKSAQQLPPQVQEQTRSVLSNMLDMDGDGNVMDDVFNMAKKFL